MGYPVSIFDGIRLHNSDGNSEELLVEFPYGIIFGAIGCKEGVWLGISEWTIEGIIEGTLIGCFEGFIYNSLVIYERSSEVNKEDYLLGLKDTIKYGDKIWVDYSKLGEELGCKERAWRGLSEWLLIAVAEGAIIFP